MEETVNILLKEFREFRVENEKRWNKNDKRWDKNDKRWEQNDKRWDKNDKRWEQNDKRWEENNKRWNENQKRWEENDEKRKNERRGLFDVLEAMQKSINERFDQLEDKIDKNTQSILEIQSVVKKAKKVLQNKKNVL